MDTWPALPRPSHESITHGSHWPWCKKVDQSNYLNETIGCRVSGHGLERGSVAQALPPDVALAVGHCRSDCSSGAQPAGCYALTDLQGGPAGSTPQAAPREQKVEPLMLPEQRAMVPRPGAEARHARRYRDMGRRCAWPAQSSRTLVAFLRIDSENVKMTKDVEGYAQFIAVRVPAEPSAGKSHHCLRLFPPNSNPKKNSLLRKLPGSCCRRCAWAPISCSM